MKRVMDFTLGLLLSFIFFVLFFPILILAIFNPRKILFTQTRIGQDNKPFKLYKLKTMNDTCDAEGKLLPDAQRLTSWGKFLRKTSIDELPQLWNVLKGDMSFVGPRPLLPQYLPLYSPRQARRHEVKPGITGWAQINGRNSISWQEKFELDVYYVENQSVLLDLRILFLTVWKVIKRKDISGSGSLTMTPFKGNPE